MDGDRDTLNLGLILPRDAERGISHAPTGRTDQIISFMFKKATYFFFSQPYMEEKMLIFGKSLIAANFLDTLNGIQEENVCKAVTLKCPIQPIL